MSYWTVVQYRLEASGNASEQTASGAIFFAGADRVSEALKFPIRRITVLETELRFLEGRLATVRAEGKQPPDDLLDLYSRLANARTLGSTRAGSLATSSWCNNRTRPLATNRGWPFY